MATRVWATRADPSFVGTGTNDSFGTLVENMAVEAVPGPATMAILGLGLAALRRKRA